MASRALKEFNSQRGDLEPPGAKNHPLPPQTASKFFNAQLTVNYTAGLL